MGIKLITEGFNDPLQLQVWHQGNNNGDHLTEEYHVEINQWCIDALGYHARTAFNVYQLKNKQDVMTFKLRWA